MPPFDASLIPEPQDEGPETVWELTRRIQATLEDGFPQVWVVGEISNYKQHTSGHVFFTLKDERASLRCIIWKSTAERLRHEITDGLEVEAKGHLSVFEKAGNYQLYVSSIKPRGVGALEVAFRRLKEKLQKEGLFDPVHKRPLPHFPRRVGIVTSPTGAAVRDIIHVLARRWPPAEIVLAPALVQGPGAAAEIVRGIRWLNRLRSIDVIIIGRGGGSLEDLWPFNEESVARAVYASDVPVVSAVGHETDFSISDFVADVRAPTPSAAAEIVVPDAREVLAALAMQDRRMARHVRHRLERLGDRLALAARSRFFAHPEELALARAQELEDLAGRLRSAARESAADRRLRLERAAAHLAEHAPRIRWQAAQGAIRMALYRLRAAGRTLLVHRWRARVDGFAQRLADLDPDRVLGRGYSRTVLERTGATLTRAADARPGDRLRTHLAEGKLASRVEEAGKQRIANVEPVFVPSGLRRATQGTAKDEVKNAKARRRKDAAGPPQRTLFE
jgi:exodeoxyribonuclease VII large subunit